MTSKLDGSERSPLLHQNINVWVPLTVVPEALALKVLDASAGNAASGQRRSRKELKLVSIACS
ncbi:hypothetical protein H6F88_01965 [Oculatella sp. FACHB-28]|uniref:hypothetical protein n=1 Tax=Oculatella sp. FACHB-28 TaxID=2692845 RepID=UPI00168A2636|nr:hypothetical protein [Oculatella sp. FACHB-28]MBD2054800.1 hypothetical protein [Oculatella sp. FACHB-28]